MVYLGHLAHYNHKNICRGVSSWTDSQGSTRPFDTLDEMNDHIVNGINETVGQEDYLIHLGDWSFGGFDYIEEFRKRIVCQNIILLLGNHDHHIQRNRQNVRSLFTDVQSYIELEVHEQDGNIFQAVCMHYPISSWNGLGKGMVHLHGHVHLPPNKCVHKGRAMDVGLDGNPLFRPYSLSEIKRKINGHPKLGITLTRDHHENNER